MTSTYCFFQPAPRSCVVTGLHHFRYDPNSHKDERGVYGCAKAIFSKKRRYINVTRHVLNTFCSLHFIFFLFWDLDVGSHLIREAATANVSDHTTMSVLTNPEQYTLEDCKGEIYFLYITQNMRLSDVREVIQDKYNVIATWGVW